MVCIFFKTTGPVLIDVLDRGKTIDNKYYVINCLTKLFDNVKLQRNKSGIKNVKILHDNARPHVHSIVTSYLENQKIKIIEYPPYSPDEFMTSLRVSFSIK